MAPHLHDWMIATHTTPPRMANMVRVSVTTVHKWMDGSSIPHPKNVADIAAVTGIWLARRSHGATSSGTVAEATVDAEDAAAAAQVEAAISTCVEPTRLPEAVGITLLEIEDRLRRLEGQIMDGVTVLAAIDVVRNDLTAQVIRIQTGATTECDQAAE